MDIEEILALPGNRDVFNALLDQLDRTERIVPFVGAGLSMPSAYPSWRSYLLELCQDDPALYTQVETELNNGHYEEAAGILQSTLGKIQFNRKLNFVFGPDTIKRRQIKGAVQLLPALGMYPILTTNFDRVLETVFRKAGEEKYFSDILWGSTLMEMAKRSFREQRNFLLKIHGDAFDAVDRVLTLEEYEKTYGATNAENIDWNRPLPQVLRWVLEGRTLLFLGCSLQQDRIMTLLENIQNDTGHYALVEMPAAELTQRRRFLFDHNILPLWYPRGRHDEAIKTVLRYLIKERYGADPGDPDEQPMPEAEGQKKVEQKKAEEKQRVDAPQHSFMPMETKTIPTQFLLCGRVDHRQKFLKLFATYFPDPQMTPQVYILHGDEDEKHDSLVNRLIEDYVEDAIDNLKLGQKVRVLQKNILPAWYYTNKWEDDLWRIKERVFNSFVESYTDAVNKGLPVAALKNLNKVSRCGIVVLSHDILASQWNHKATKSLIRAYTRYWTSHSVAQNDKPPKFLIFLNVVYEQNTPVAYDKARIVRELEEIDREERHCKLLPELKPFSAEQLNEWWEQGKWQKWCKDRKWPYGAGEEFFTRLRRKLALESKNVCNMKEFEDALIYVCTQKAAEGI